MYAVIIAGGKGTRFWPLSREKSPKQILKLTDDVTLLEKTVERVLSVISYENIYIVTVENLKNKISKLLPKIPKKNIISEPFGRNTAPAIGLAAIHINKRDPEGVMLVLPADHSVSKVKKFISVIKKGEKYLKKYDKLISLGIKPSYPETGYGYIQSGKSIVGSGNNIFLSIKKFTEKPNLKTAKKYVARQDYFWNSGMFLWKVETILNEITSCLPELSKQLKNIEPAIGTRQEKAVTKKIYQKMENESIDYGVMEKTNKGAVIPCDIGWNDLGSWLALEGTRKKDNENNTIIGKFLGLNSKNLIVHSPRKLIAGIGLEDLVIVDTPDVILICPKKNAQDVKVMVELVKKHKLEKYL